MRTPHLSAAIAIAAAAAAGSSGKSSNNVAARRGGHTPFERQTEAEALYAQLEQRWRAEQASLEADEQAAGGASGNGSGSGDGSGADGNGDGAYERAQTAKLAGQRRTHRRATLRFQSAV